MRTQSFTFHFDAPPQAVYKALLNPKLLPRWRVPDSMTLEVHHFEPREGGKFRISLSYDDAGIAGKSGQNTDIYHGYFKTLIPDEKIVEVMEFESKGPDFTGEMTITTTLCPEENGGTKIVISHENLPAAVPEDQNEIGWKMSFRKLAELLRA